MSTDDDTERGVISLPRRAAKRLLATASDLVSRARDTSARSRAMADVLLLDSQSAIFAELHRRFTIPLEEGGESGLARALEALDLMWENVRALRGGAPALLHTLSSSDDTVQDRRARFYVESTALLEEAIRAVFSADLGHLALPPDRLAIMVRVAIEGLVVELAQARTAEDVATVDQAYADLRALFERYVTRGSEAEPLAEVSMEPIPLPW